MASMLEQAAEQKTKVSLADAWEEFCASRDWELSCSISWTLGPHGRGATLALWWGDGAENRDDNGIAVTIHDEDAGGRPTAPLRGHPDLERRAAALEHARHCRGV